jgi:predicted nucleotidyltransferase
MGKTALDLSADERQAYRPAEAIRRRRIERQAETDLRRDKAWQIARKAAELLKSDFGAARVVVFGSLARGNWLTPWSDIDLAAWRIPPAQFFRAVAALIDLEPGMKIDLVDPESCHPGLRETIRREGIEL